MNKAMSYDIEDIDFNVMNEVRSIMGERWPDLVKTYLEDAAKHIENIKDGFKNGTMIAVASSAHPLKSISSSMGINGLSKIASTIEYDTKHAIENDGNISHLQQTISLLDKALDKARPQLINTLDNI